jgi:hypothetical protein
LFTGGVDARGHLVGAGLVGVRVAGSVAAGDRPGRAGAGLGGRKISVAGLVA